MNVLLLGPADSPLAPLVRAWGHDSVEWSAPVSPAWLDEHRIEFAISYRYRHIVPASVLAHLPNRIVNLHVSLLPWNRGADPNLWSFLESTPKGVTIHYMDDGLDTGDIICQEELAFPEADETLATTYARLSQAILRLFRLHGQGILTGACARRTQQGVGSAHRMRDKNPYLPLLTHGWNTPVRFLEGKALPQASNHGNT